MAEIVNPYRLFARVPFGACPVTPHMLVLVVPVKECFSLSVSLTKYFSRNQVLARLGRRKLPSMGRVPLDA